MKARLPANEAQRLRLLQDYGVLDTAAERSFDDIVKLATQLCETPAAMITFVDTNRQWFKSAHGLQLTETDRDSSFCAHTILGDDVLVVPDATKHPQFSDNPLVTGPPHIRYYAGAPLKSADDVAVGSLAVVDFRPREPSAGQLDALQILARQVVAQLELRRHALRSEDRATAAETDVRIVAERHRALFESALDAIVTMDASGRVTEFNPAAERLFGYARTDAIGAPMAELIIPEDLREQHAAGMENYLRTGTTTIMGRRVEVTAMRRDGTRFPAELSIHRVGSGEPLRLSGFIRDITERVRAEEGLRESAKRYQQQRQALTSLIQDEQLYHGELSAALRGLTEMVSTTLNVARVSVWQYDRGQALIRCLNLYELAADRHAQGAELSASKVPSYFDAMARHEVISASDARRDPRTTEFTDDYLVPLGITSMLDARVHLHGALHGVLCLEHVGARREWTQDEESFAIAAANLVSLALEGEQRRRAQDALVTQTQILTAVTESLAAYVERDDWKDAFARLLRCALTVTESEYGFVGVVAERTELRVLAHEGIIWDKTVNREFYDQALRDYTQRGYLTFHSFDNLFGRAITTGEVVIANDPARDPRSSGIPDGHPEMRSFLGVPIRGRDEVLGVVALANRPGGYGREESERIQALVRQAGGLCANYQQHERQRAQDDEQRKIESAFRASEERLRLVSRATNDVVWDWNLVTNELFVPEGFRKLFGDDSTEQHMNIEAWYSRVHPDDDARIGRSLRVALDQGAEVWSDEYRFKRADGDYATVFDRGFVLRSSQGVPVRMIGAMMDISDRKQLEAQFRQAQKLEAVGQLAGGVAHDFNNMLTVIQGHASLVLESEPLSDALRDSVRQILDVSERGAGLTRQLLAFSRKQVLQTVDLDLNAAVNGMTRLLQRILREDVKLLVQPSDQPAIVRADASMMEQVILNLAVNARDAMTAGGTLTIRTTLERFDADRLPPAVDASPGAFVRISITDTGCGIPDDVLPHIFEPFFSTKGVERGSGLGLATVYGVVKQHRGWITVRSTVGTGTTFDVYLPLSDAAAVAARPAADHAAGATAHETILIVEDEPGVRLLARRVLERRGYTVLEAASGPAALTQWHQHRDVIDAVLTDMVMPDGMSGLDLANQLLSENPRLRVIVTSGYSVDLGGEDVSQTTHISFLAKPYSAPQLEVAVRASLNK